MIENYGDVWRAEVLRTITGDENIVVPKAKWTGRDKNNNTCGKGKNKCCLRSCIFLLVDALMVCS